MSDPFQQLPLAKYIKTDAALGQLVDTLQGVSIVGLDTESNSLYAYQEQVCLIQLSVRRSDSSQADDVEDYIIDPLTIDDLSALGKFVAGPNVESIFHGADYDVAALKRDFDFQFGRIFDTYLAAKTLGWQRVGLSSLLDTCFGVKLDKKYQQANWGKRPLSEEQLRYAQMDTHYLLNLRELLHDELAKEGYLEEARELFAQIADSPPHNHVFDPEGFWSNKYARTFDGQQMAILREVYLWREQTARQLDRPPFKVISDRVMARLVEIAPTQIHQLYDVKGFPKRWVKRYGNSLIDAIGRGKAARAPRPRHNNSNGASPDVITRYDALHNWRKSRAAERGVESDIIVSKQALWAIAKQQPRSHDELESISELGSYRRAKYGREILNILQELRS